MQKRLFNFSENMKSFNTWNCFFHKKELKKELANLFIINTIIERYQEFMDKIDVSQTFDDVLYYHKEAWKAGFQNENIGPCPYGIFRANSIEDMNLNDIYLGGIYGLFTLPASDWEKIGNVDEFNTVLKQYKNLLTNNFTTIYLKARRLYDSYRVKGYPERICQR